MKLFLATLLAIALRFAISEEISLFNGRDLSGWKQSLGTWSVVGDVSVDAASPKAFVVKSGEGVMLNSPAGKTVNITSVAEHGDAQLHVEFNVPKGSNSGIYVQGRYEIQVLDSYGQQTVGEHDCGAIYQRWDPARGKGNEGYEEHAPKVNACKAPGQWQTFDITYRAPRFDASGNKTANAKFVKVVHNEQVIHENVEMNGPTRGSVFATEADLGPIILQGDHGPVAYRNLKITQLEEQAASR
ncbi:MAG TPA: DUF1080 domain-containing protein [Pirellulales bacterium]|jgi:hypothetical protein|nr:DUF1080 domain-containing protein [Pirellulales bacterium]